MIYNGIIAKAKRNAEELKEKPPQRRSYNYIITTKVKEQKMSIKCKYSDIKAIYNWCEEYADEHAKTLLGTQPSAHIIAYYTPSQANWSYQVGLVMLEQVAYEVVLVFGEVKAVKLANIPNYSMEELKERRF